IVKKGAELASRGDSLRSAIEKNSHHIALAYAHGDMLLRFRDEEIFVESPIKKSTVFVHMNDFQAGEVSHLGERFLCCSDGPIFRVRVDKHADSIAHLELSRAEFVREEQLT